MEKDGNPPKKLTPKNKPGRGRGDETERVERREKNEHRNGFKSGKRSGQGLIGKISEKRKEVKTERIFRGDSILGVEIFSSLSPPLLPSPSNKSEISYIFRAE
ncbi:hypothetical protein TNCT_99941 [Trichonephila clavata]|uniref:Uncharacterized protein n=1 Tax=Trichonephila clavata TaxID=2740835 RepID=A0A8X6K7J1_TRICU|nr:hypothetical protein TNCT_99941 [Trichonephila clavata]